MTVITGTPDSETLVGTVGDDLISAYGGNDVVYTLGGADTVYGGAGNDRLNGDFGQDLLFGESGDDTLISGGDTDRLYGGDGNDYIIVNDLNYDGNSTAWGDTGNDTLALFGTSGGHAFGGDGIDTLMLFNVDNADLFVDMANQTLDGHGAFTGVTFDSFERLVVQSFATNDTVIGGYLNDRIMVGAGHNLVAASWGNDFVDYVANGASTLDGGSGYDVLSVHAGDSSLHFVVNRSDGSVDDGQSSVITKFEAYKAYGGIYDDTGSFFAGNDEFHGAQDADTAFGYHGNDSLFGDDGKDMLYGGGGNDLLYGGTGDDTLYGGNGNDLLGGGRGNDVVYGGNGDDRIRFYLGNDTVTGGAGHDTFMFTRNEAGFETITDFESGIDHLRFTAAYVSAGLETGPLDPARLSLGGPVGTVGQFVLTYDGGSDTSSLRWFPHGSNVAGGVYGYVTFIGNVTLTVDDFQIV
ncbi:MAG: calcium-binding protein [Cypionkella sp.]